MNLTLTNDQKAIVDSVAESLPALFPREDLLASVRTRKPRSHDAARWLQVGELGWFGLSVPEEAQGVGLGLAEDALLFLLLGRALAPLEFIGTVLAARVAPPEIAIELVEGRRRAGLIVDDYVVAAGSGELALQVTDEGGELVEIAGLEPLHGVDETVEVSRIGSHNPVASVNDPLLIARLRVLAGAMLVGLAEETTQMASEYAKVREQFGKPIGTFQAVKHRCSEMAFRAQLARCQVLAASLFVHHEKPSASLEAAAAFLLAADAGWRNAADNVQNHGGIGYTAEHPAGLYVKRAQVLRLVGLGESRATAAVLRSGGPDYS